jgi:hypothetical protein
LSKHTETKRKNQEYFKIIAPRINEARATMQSGDAAKAFGQLANIAESLALKTTRLLQFREEAEGRIKALNRVIIDQGSRPQELTRHEEAIKRLGDELARVNVPALAERVEALELKRKARKVEKRYTTEEITAALKAEIGAVSAADVMEEIATVNPEQKDYSLHDVREVLLYHSAHISMIPIDAVIERIEQGVKPLKATYPVDTSEPVYTEEEINEAAIRMGMKYTGWIMTESLKKLRDPDFCVCVGWTPGWSESEVRQELKACHVFGKSIESFLATLRHLQEKQAKAALREVGTTESLYTSEEVNEAAYHEDVGHAIGSIMHNLLARQRPHAIDGWTPEWEEVSVRNTLIECHFSDKKIAHFLDTLRLLRRGRLMAEEAMRAEQARTKAGGFTREEQSPRKKSSEN